MTTPDDPSSLDELLRAGLAAPEVPDDGFTLHVIGALPRRRRATGSPRLALTIAWSCSGAGLVLALWTARSPDWAQGAASSLNDSAAFLLVNPWMGVAFAAAGVSYAVAMVAANAAYRALGRSG